MKYNLIIANDRYEFLERVNQALSQGWKLQGGVATTSRLGETTYVQAVTLNEDDMAQRAFNLAPLG